MLGNSLYQHKYTFLLLKAAGSLHFKYPDHPGHKKTVAE